MSFPVSTIEAIQRAGAAVFEADSQLKGLTQDYAQRIRTQLRRFRSWLHLRRYFP